MSDRVFWLAYMGLVVLLPMVPALAIFKLLPSRAAVAGPFHGLKINLGGAFAAYFVILLLLLATFRSPPPANNVQVWTVQGRIQLSDHEEDSPFFETVRFSLVPPPEIVDNDGSFSIKVLATSESEKKVELGALRVEASGYQPVSKSLSNLPRDPKTRTVKIEKTIVLRPKPDSPYQAGVPLQASGGNP